MRYPTREELEERQYERYASNCRRKLTLRLGRLRASLDINWPHLVVHHEEYPATWKGRFPVSFNLVRLHMMDKQVRARRLWIYTPWLCPHIDFVVSWRKD